MSNNAAASSNASTIQATNTGLANPQPQEGSYQNNSTILPNVNESQSSIIANQKREGAIASNDDEQQLFREIVEEEKLDEQAAKKEEIEAAEDEAAGIMPQPLMLMQPIAAATDRIGSDEDEDEEIESEDEYFH